jgi:hypothetical protein
MHISSVRNDATLFFILLSNKQHSWRLNLILHWCNNISHYIWILFVESIIHLVDLWKFPQVLIIGMVQSKSRITFCSEPNNECMLLQHACVEVAIFGICCILYCVCQICLVNQQWGIKVEEMIEILDFGWSWSVGMCWMMIAANWVWTSWLFREVCLVAMYPWQVMAYHVYWGNICMDSAWCNILAFGQGRLGIMASLPSR